MFEIINHSDLRKWARFVLSCGVAAFVSFAAAFGTIGYGAIAAGSPPTLSFFYALFGASGAMAAATLASARANELWKELTVILPKQPPSENPKTQISKPEDQSARPPALTG